jgi:CBS domain-containing protein
MLVETILAAKGTTVHTLPATATLSEAVELLNAQNIGAIVITEASGRVRGILSERDIVRRLDRDPAAMLARPVTAAMTSTVLTCTRTTTIADLMERMTTHRVRHMPVVEDGRLAGIVSIGDVVKRKIEETEQEAAALKDYIAG